MTVDDVWLIFQSRRYKLQVTRSDIAGLGKSKECFANRQMGIEKERDEFPDDR